ncbi:zinc knuckle CX2CX4HX4C containing protein [Tanacetum coccineum]
MNRREGMKDEGELPRDVAERMNKLTGYNSAKTKVTVSGTGNTFGGTAVGSNTLIAKGVGNVHTYTHDLVAKHFGVSLITLGDIDGFTKDLEIGKYELWSDMASELRTKIMDSIRAMAADLLAINPNSDSLDKGNEAGVIPNIASGSRLISETNVEALLGVKFYSQHDIDTFSKSVEEGKPSVTKQVVEPNHDDPIVHDVNINTKSTSYAGAAGANHKVQPKVTSNFRPLVADTVFEGVNISIPRKVIKKRVKVLYEDLHSELRYCSSELSDSYTVSGSCQIRTPCQRVVRPYCVSNLSSSAGLLRQVITAIADRIREILLKIGKLVLRGEADSEIRQKGYNVKTMKFQVVVKVSRHENSGDILRLEALWKTLFCSIILVRNICPIILKKWSMDTRLLKEELSCIPVWVKLHDVPIQVFEEDDISLIASFVGKLVMLDSYTSSMCNDSWSQRMISSKRPSCPKKVVSPPIVSTSNVVTPTIEKNNDGFQKVGNKKKKKGQSKSTNDGQLVGPSVKQNLIYEPKAATSEPKKRATNVGNTSKLSSMVKSTGNSSKKGNITTSNSYSALENDEEEDEEHVKNVYDESANLFPNSKPDESSTFMVAAR